MKRQYEEETEAKEEETVKAKVREGETSCDEVGGGAERHRGQVAGGGGGEGGGGGGGGGCRRWASLTSQPPVRLSAPQDQPQRTGKR